MQWWGALSQQFAQLATNAMKDGATDAAKKPAGTMVKQSFDAAGETLRKTAAAPGAVMGAVVNRVAKASARKAPAKAPSATSAARKRNAR